MSTAPKNPKEAEPAAPSKEAAAAPAAAEEKPAARKEKSPKGKDGKGKAPKGEGAPGAPKKVVKKIPDNPDFRYIVRLANADLDGTRATGLALTGVRGVGLRMAEVVCKVAGVNANEMIGNLPEATVDGIELVLGQLPQKLPPWMLNHPRDYQMGEVHHLVGGDLETSRRDDVNLLKMIRSYRGVRHERGQKVRGQRTRSNGRTGMAAGVLKKDAKAAAAAAKGGDDKDKEKPAASAAAPAAAAATPAATGAAAKKEKT
ncbi:MAG: 30S ribosomal protein S13 [Thermoplasmata archaeon]|nr:30S ribosomal protein S13 [Thermoplasmata archaeon]